MDESYKPVVGNLVAVGEVDGGERRTSCRKSSHPCIRDLVAVVETGSGERRTSSSQSSHPCVRDLGAVVEVDVGERRTPTTQNSHPCIRDLVAVLEADSGERRTPSSQSSHPCITRVGRMETHRDQTFSAHLRHSGSSTISHILNTSNTFHTPLSLRQQLVHPLRVSTTLQIHTHIVLQRSMTPTRMYRGDRGLG